MLSRLKPGCAGSSIKHFIQRECDRRQWNSLRSATAVVQHRNELWKLWCWKRDGCWNAAQRKAADLTDPIREYGAVSANVVATIRLLATAKAKTIEQICSQIG